MVFSAGMAERWTVPGRYCVISINEPPFGGSGVKEYAVRDGYLAILRLKFHDLLPDSAPANEIAAYTLFDEGHAREILQFWERYRHEVDRFMCHCAAGISRSAGVAVVLARLEGNREVEQQIWSSTHPNAHVIRTLEKTARDLGFARSFDANLPEAVAAASYSPRLVELGKQLRALPTTRSRDNVLAITMVGTRKTTPKEDELIAHIAKRIVERARAHGQRVVIRSGGAQGADSAAERGALAAGSGDAIEIFHPFKRAGSDRAGHYVFDAGPVHAIAQQIVAEVHPAWNRCSPVARALHIRNFCQILGIDGQQPSAALVYCADEGPNGVNGGTRTAVELAKLAPTLGFAPIPSFNIREVERCRALADWLDERWPRHERATSDLGWSR